MWTGGRIFVCKLQQSLNLQGLARRQSGHDWLGPGARAPVEQEPSWGFLPEPLQLGLDDTQALAASPESWKQTGWAGQGRINEAKDESKF